LVGVVLSFFFSVFFFLFLLFCIQSFGERVRREREGRGERDGEIMEEGMQAARQIYKGPRGVSLWVKGIRGRNPK
jgi:hypothetical protein